MKLLFIELPPFERYRKVHLSDDEYRAFQNELLENPEKCDLFDKFSNSQREWIKHLVSAACRAMMSDDYR